jgi:hypothetical protein
LAIFLVARLLTNQDDSRVRGPFPEYRLCCPLVERASVADRCGGLQRRKAEDRRETSASLFVDSKML